MLASWEAFPATLPEQLVEETPLQFWKGKRQAMTGLDVAGERAQDASRQQKQDKRSAAALAAADHEAEAQEREREKEEEILALNWIADTQFQFSQLSYNDPEADGDDGQPPSPLEQSASLGLSNNQPPATEPGSQALDILSDSEISRISGNDEP